MLPCPRCRAPLPAGENHCPACGCHLGSLQQLLGTQQVGIERLIDHAKCLALKDSQRLEHSLDVFERRFPQVFCVVFIGGLLPGVTPAEAGFWLLNQGVCLRESEPRQGRHGVAIIVDPAGRRTGIALGYALEAVLPNGFAGDLLRRVELHLAHDEFVRAVDLMLTALDRQLRARGSAQRRRAPAGDPARTHLGLQPLPAEKGGAATRPRA